MDFADSPTLSALVPTLSGTSDDLPLDYLTDDFLLYVFSPIATPITIKAITPQTTPRIIPIELFFSSS